MHPQAQTRNDLLILVLSVAFVLGMAAAILFVALWYTHPAAVAGGLGHRAAILFCPPFVLMGALTGIADNPLAFTLAAGSVIFGNASLYAGVAAFLYWAASTFWPGRSSI